MCCGHLSKAGEAILSHDQLQKVEDGSDGVSLSGAIDMVYSSISTHFFNSMKEGGSNGFMFVEQFCNDREGKPDLCHPLDVVQRDFTM